VGVGLAVCPLLRGVVGCWGDVERNALRVSEVK
jgi:hypothetical protein